jgi:IstB-like ATP binding protein
MPTIAEDSTPGDNWGLASLDAAARHDLLEILEERYGRQSTIITSQIPVDKWHELIGEPTLDRIVHNAHRINHTGHSLHRSRTNKPYPPARHRAPGDIMSESRATSSRNARATSSESAHRRLSTKAQHISGSVHKRRTALST